MMAYRVACWVLTMLFWRGGTWAAMTPFGWYQTKLLSKLIMGTYKMYMYSTSRSAAVSTVTLRTSFNHIYFISCFQNCHHDNFNIYILCTIYVGRYRGLRTDIFLALTLQQNDSKNDTPFICVLPSLLVSSPQSQGNREVKASSVSMNATCIILYTMHNTTTYWYQFCCNVTMAIITFMFVITCTLISYVYVKTHHWRPVNRTCMQW